VLLIGEWALPAARALGPRFASAVACGFDGVELVWCDEGSILAAACPSAVLKAAQREGVALASLCTEPVTWRSEAGGAHVDGLEQLVAVASELGAMTVVINLGRLNANDATRRLVAGLRRAGIQRGVHVAFENGMPGDLVTHPRELRLMGDRLDDHIDLHLDIGNAVATATLDDWLAQDRHHLRSLHLKDWSTGARAPRACGHGDVGWPALWAELSERLPPTITVEHSARALGPAALSSDLGGRIHTWMATGQMPGAPA
jgi:sugar phosphate isomerase/epimerase